MTDAEFLQRVALLLQDNSKVVELCRPEVYERISQIAMRLHGWAMEDELDEVRRLRDEIPARDDLQALLNRMESEGLF